MSVIENGYLLVDLRSALFDSRFNSFEDEIDSKMTVPFWKKYVGLRVETLVCLSLACPPVRVRVMFYITVLTNLAILPFPKIVSWRFKKKNLNLNRFNSLHESC